MGIEPTWSAWKAEVLPLNYTRVFKRLVIIQHKSRIDNTFITKKKAVHRTALDSLIIPTPPYEGCCVRYVEEM